MDQLKRYEEYGYIHDLESRLRGVADNGGNHEESLAMQAANQIKHLKDSLRELVSIVKIHSKATGNNFAWAEVEEAEKALAA